VKIYAEVSDAPLVFSSSPPSNSKLCRRSACRSVTNLACSTARSSSYMPSPHGR
jgi:hypothetical protein